MQKNILLSNFSSYKIGGPANYFVQISNLSDLQGLNPVRGLTPNVFILGGGTNVLISDKGFDGLVVHCSLKGIERKDEKIKIGSGVLLPDVVQYCIDHELSNLEWAGGLPGTVGGAVRGNAGAFGGEIKDQVVEVESFDLRSRKIKKRTNSECQFAYRSSFFKTNPNEFITSVVLKLQKGDKKEIQKSINEKIDYRNLKHPMDYPNIGSTFKNIPVEKVSDQQKLEFASFTKDDPFPVVLTTKLLALAGLKGRRVGDAMISEKHPNFIVNLGSAKSSDVLKLVEIAKKRIKEKWGIELEEEIMYLR